jgi:hypothetical protein
MQRLAAAPTPTTPLPNAEVLWWQALALRQLDERRRLTAKLEIGERIQTGCVIAAALALLVWMLSQLPKVSQLPGYVLASVACAMLLVIVAVLMLTVRSLIR